MLDLAPWINRTENYRKALKLSSAVAALGTALMFASSPAQAQQITPGIDPQCTIVVGEAICEGDLGDGVRADPTTPDFDNIIIRNPTGPIAPPGYAGIDLLKDNGNLGIVIEDGVVIDVFDDPAIPGAVRGITATVQNGFDLSLQSAADITVDDSSPLSIGIEATALGGGGVTITNSGDITMGAGVAIAARADNISLNTTGELRTIADDSDVIRLGSANGSANIDLIVGRDSVLSSEGDSSNAIVFEAAPGGIEQWTAFLDGAVINTVGSHSAGIMFEELGGTSNLTVTLLDSVIGTGGANSDGIHVASLGDGTAAEFNLASSIISVSGAGADGIDIAAIGQGSAFTFNMQDSFVITGLEADSQAILIGGLAGGNSAINVNLLNVDLTTQGDTSNVFEISNFIQNASVGVFTIGDSNFASLGDDSGAIVVGSPVAGALDRTSQTIRINDSIVSTEGNRSGGIFVNSNLDGATNSDFGILVTGVEISTLGADSHALEILGAQNVQVGDFDNPTPNPTNGDVLSTVAVNVSEDITAAGENSDAIRITNQGRTSILVNNGATASGGTGAGVAINLLEASNNDGLLDAVEAEATVLKARLSDRAMNLITTYINSAGRQTPSAVGGGASGFDPIMIDPFDFTPFDQLMEVDGATVESMMGAGAIVSASPLALGTSNGAIIRTGGDNAAVISAGEAIALVASDTTFSSMGDNSPLFSLTELTAGGGTGFYAAMTDITATTTGVNSDAIAMGGGVSDSIGVLFLAASDLAAPSVVSTSGDGSSAISFDAPDLSIFTGAISRSEVSTMGADAVAILLNMGSTSSASLELLDTLVSTSGDGSDVLRLNTGSASDFTFIVADSELISEGDESALLRVTGREVSNVGSMVMIGGTLSSLGSNSGGIIIEGDEAAGGSAHTFFFGESSISTAGENSDGFVFERIANSPDGGGFSVGSFTLDTVDITTRGADSDAFFAGSLLAGSVRTVNLLNSSFATSGDNSRAYFAEALSGGNVTSLLIRGSTFSTEGANSTAVTFNEGSVFDLMGAADSSVSAFDIRESVISTLGDNSLGIDVATLAGDRSTTVITMSDNQISTAGANSDAISIGTQAAIGRDGASHAVSIDLSTIETLGDDSRGIYFGSLVDGLIGVDAFDGGVTDAVFFTSDNVIATSGAGSHGIEYATITGDLEDGILDIVLVNDTVQTRGDNAIGMLFGGLEGAFIDSMATNQRPQLTMLFSPLSIATEGDGSHGIQIGDLPAFDVADNAVVTLSVITRTITTTGDGAHGVVIGSGWGDASSEFDTPDTGANRYAILDVTGIINVSGAGSHGIVSDSLINEFRIDTDGSVTSADGFALNFAAVDEGQTALNLGTIDGDVIFGGGDDVFDSSGTFTGNIDMGAGANAIFVRAGGLFNSLDNVLLGAGNAITVEGDISPGGVDPIQVTNIGSDLVFAAGSQFLIDIDGMAADTNAAGFFQSDRITVDGDITINGGTLVVESLTPEGDFDQQAQFLILDAAGTVTGEFADLMADLPFLDLNLTYNAGNVILNAGRQGPVVPFASLGLTPNQRAVGASFDALEPNAMGDLDDVIDQLIFASTDQALTAFDTASGEIYASLLAQAGHDGLRRSRETLARARSAANSGWGIWGGITVSDSSTDGDGNGAAVSQDDFGFDVGIDYVGEDNAWAAGVSTGWRDGSLDVPDRLSTADYDTWYLAGHARYGTGGQGVTVTAALDISETDAAVARTLTVNGISRNALGNADIDTFSIAGEARYGLNVSDNWAIGPVVSVIHADSDLELGDETGAGSVALTSADASDGQTRFGAGVFANFQSDNAVFDLSGQYVEGSSNTVGARLAFADGGNAPFTVLAPVTDGSGLLTSASARIELGSGVTLGAQVDALFGGDVEEINASAVLGWRF